VIEFAPMRAVLRCGLIFVVAGMLSAAPVTYQVSGTFTDGKTFSGTITFDNASGTVVSFHVVSQFNAANGLGTTYDSATGTSTIFFPISPPPVSGTFFNIILVDTSTNILGFTVSGSPSAFGGGPIFQSVPLQGGDSVLSLEESFTSFNSRGLSTGMFSGPPSAPVGAPALSPIGILVAAGLLVALGCYKTRLA
jgi:hypothetical protein